jgi:hypothetical protein
VAIIGTAKVTATIGKDRLEIEGLVSEDVTEPMIGIEWLGKNDAFWMFKQGAIRIRGKLYKLFERQPQNVWANYGVQARATRVAKMDVILEQSEEEEEEETVDESTMSKTVESKDCWTDEEAAPILNNDDLDSSVEIAGVNDWWTHACTREAQQSDEAISLVYEAMNTSSERPPMENVYAWPPVAQALWHNWSRLKIRNDILRYHWENEDSTEFRWLVVVPAKYRHGEFWKRHVDWYGRHRSCEEVFELMEHDVYWPRWQIDVQVWTRACQQCRTGRRGRRPDPKPPDGRDVTWKSVAVQTAEMSAAEDEECPDEFENLPLPTMIFWNRKFRDRYIDHVVRGLEDRTLRDRRRLKKPGRFKD